jgi:ABC-2 type transport system permease protein
MKLRVLLAFFKKELGQTLRDPRMRTLLFLAPLIQLSLFGLALKNEVRNIRLAVYAAPSDSLAWEIGHRAEGGGWIQLVQVDESDPFKALQAGSADAALVAPPGGLTQQVGRGHGTAQLLIDGTNTVRAGGVQSYMESIRQDVMRERVLAPGAVQPPQLKVVDRVLYNPTLESKYFMVPGVLVMLLLLISLTVTSGSISREREGGTFETLLASPVGTGSILLGKSLPFVVVGLIGQLPLVLAVSYFGFGVPFRGTLVDLYIASAAFLACNVSLGVLISTGAKNQQQAMMGSFLVMYPAQMLSGITYPLDNMPFWLKPITYLNPLRYFAILVRNILLKGGSTELFWPNVGGLMILAIFLMGLAWIRFKPTLN